MAINAYIGIPGSGKSYEVVKSVILPAFMNGRRIVTNIVGIDKEAITDYVYKLRGNDKDFNPNNLGEIIVVEDKNVLQDNFFPFKGSFDEQTIAKSGDLICLDEVWRIFDSEKSIKETHKSFLAEHRHFTNEKGETCDLVVINQSINNIPKFIKDRIETTYRMSKLSALGLTSRYRIDVYTGARIYKSNLINSIQSKYDKDIFKLYKSYDGNNAKEQKIDSRNNYFKSFKFISMIILMIFFLLVSLYFLLGFMSNQNKLIQETPNSNTVSNERESKNSKGTINKEASTTTTDSSRTNKPQQTAPKLSSSWKIIGYIKREGDSLVILSNDKDIRYEKLSRFRSDGRFLYGFIDGEKVTFYSGNSSSSGNKEALKWN